MTPLAPPAFGAASLRGRLGDGLRGGLRADLRARDGRQWLSSGLSGVVVAALGLALAGAVSLLPAQPAAQGSQPDALYRFTSSGQVSPDFDATSRTLRDDFTPQSAVAQSLQRSYQLATDQQQIAMTSTALSRATREAALAGTKAAAQQNQQRLADAEQQRTIQAQVAEEMKARAAEFKAAAEAAVAAGRTIGGNASTSGTGETSGNGAPTTGSLPSGPIGSGAAPISADVIGAGFGAVGSWARYHTGVDFRAGFGTPIHAAADGVVTLSGTNGDGWAGNHVTIRHSNGMSTLYAHMSRTAATEGQIVRAGDVIGYVGATGRAFGPHLHFEVYPAGVRPGDVYRAVNPVPWLQALGVSVRQR